MTFIMEQRGEIRLWAVLVWLIIWQLVSMGLDSDLLLVSPAKAVYRLGQLMCEAVFWRSVAFTLSRILAGFLLAAAAGSALAAGAFRHRRLWELLAPVMLVMKSVPVASFIILALIWFSPGNLSVLISFLMVLPVIYTNVYSGIQSADRQLLEMAWVFRLSKLRMVRYIYLPHVLPFFYSACSVSLGMSWKAGVAAEVIGIPKGSVGERLQQAKVYLDTPDLFAWTLVVVITSLFFEKVVLFLIKRGMERLCRLK